MRDKIIAKIVAHIPQFSECICEAGVEDGLAHMMDCGMSDLGVWTKEEEKYLSDNWDDLYREMLKHPAIDYYRA